MEEILVQPDELPNLPGPEGREEAAQSGAEQGLFKILR